MLLGVPGREFIWMVPPARPSELIRTKPRQSAIQPPDCDIENARKGNPCRERHETPSRQPVESMEHDDSSEDDQELRNDVDCAQQRTVRAKEHPRPSCIERGLGEEQGQR